MGRRKPRLCRGQSTAHVLSDIDPRYATIENVFLTPHLGSATEDTRNAMGLLLLEGLHAFETGQAARNRVC